MALLHDYYRSNHYWHFLSGQSPLPVSEPLADAGRGPDAGK